MESITKQFEQIIHDNMIVFNDDLFKTSTESAIACEEIHKREAIRFKDWCDRYSWEPDFEQKNYTNEELFDLFQNEIKKDLK